MELIRLYPQRGQEKIDCRTTIKERKLGAKVLDRTFETRKDQTERLINEGNITAAIRYVLKIEP